MIHVLPKLERLGQVVRINCDRDTDVAAAVGDSIVCAAGIGELPVEVTFVGGFVDDKLCWVLDLVPAEA